MAGKSFSGGTWTAYLANTHDAAHRNQAVDRVAYTSASGSYTLANTKGYFRLFDTYRAVCSKIRMTGIITYANENLRAPAGWMNYFGQPLVNYSAWPFGYAGVYDSEFRDVALDIVGLDDATEVKFGTRKKIIQIPVVAPITNVGVADAQAMYVVPEAYDGYRIAKVQADVATAGAGTGDTTVQIAKASGGGSYANLLSTPVAITQGTVTNGNTPLIQRDAARYVPQPGEQRARAHQSQRPATDRRQIRQHRHRADGPGRDAVACAIVVFDWRSSDRLKII